MARITKYVMCVAAGVLVAGFIARGIADPGINLENSDWWRYWTDAAMVVAVLSVAGALLAVAEAFKQRR